MIELYNKKRKKKPKKQKTSDSESFWVCSFTAGWLSCPQKVINVLLYGSLVSFCFLLRHISLHV